MTAIENQLKLLEKVNNEKEQIETEIGELTETNESVRRYIELRQKQESIKTDMEELASDIGETIEEEEWKPDKISKGKKGIYRCGTNAILRSTRQVRKIVPKRFVEKYPFVVMEMVEDGKLSIPIYVAEKSLGKDEVNEMCETTVQYKYEFQSRKIPTSEPEPEQEKKTQKMKVS